MSVMPFISTSELSATSGDASAANPRVLNARVDAGSARLSIEARVEATGAHVIAKDGATGAAPASAPAREAIARPDRRARVQIAHMTLRESSTRKSSARGVVLWRRVGNPIYVRFTHWDCIQKE